MRVISKCGFALVLMTVTVVVQASAPITRFDEFADINCEDEYARLDNFAIHLSREPHAKGYIIFYGGKLFRGRLPRRGEAAVRAARMKPYLVNRRGVPSDQVVVIDGGYSEGWRAELWIVPPGAQPPSPSPTVSLSEMKFRKGKAGKRAFQCSI